MRVEQALRLLPGLEALGPLRGLVLASSAPDESSRWGSAAPYLTVGKWNLSVDQIRRSIPTLLERISLHLSHLYHHYADALAREQEGDMNGVVEHLLRAARLEEQVGRYDPARQWGEVALRIAEGLTLRRPEIQVLGFLGGIARAQGEYLAAARHYQRALVLAEAEFDEAGAIESSEGQGIVALMQGQYQGAGAWLSRAERLAVGEVHAVRRARILRELAEVARRQGDAQLAEARLRGAREIFEPRGEALEMAQLLDAQGRLHLAQDQPQASLASFREALAWLMRGGRDPRIECGIRLHLAELHHAAGRDVEAEEEMRRAEKVAIGHDLGRRLVQVYTHLGALRGRQGAETGFVFFEQAIALCQLLGPAPTLEAEVYHQYGIFKAGLAHPEEARGWLERAKELFITSGGGASLELIDEELRHLSA